VIALREARRDLREVPEPRSPSVKYCSSQRCAARSYSGELGRRKRQRVGKCSIAEATGTEIDIVTLDVESGSVGSPDEVGRAVAFERPTWPRRGPG
jgi:hypothetical protein